MNIERGPSVHTHRQSCALCPRTFRIVCFKATSDKKDKSFFKEMSDVTLTHYSKSLIFDHQKFNFHKTLLLDMYIFEFSRQNLKVFVNKRNKYLNFRAKNLYFDRKLNFQNIGKNSILTNFKKSDSLISKFFLKFRVLVPDFTKKINRF